MAVQKKTLIEIFEERCGTNIVPVHFSKFLDTLEEIYAENPELFKITLNNETPISKLVSSSYATGFGDAMLHVITVLIEEGFIAPASDRN